MNRSLRIFKLLIGFSTLTIVWFTVLHQIYITKVSAQNFIPSDITRTSEQLEIMQLNQNGEVHDINLSPNGEVIVSDYKAGEIRVVSPRLNQYTVYQALGPVENASMDQNGAIWWVDGVERIGVITPTTKLSTTWVITSDEQVLLSNFTFDDKNDPWFAEGFGATSKLYQFKKANQQLCTHVISGGVASSGLVYHEHQFWFVNWSKDIVVRYTPDLQEMSYWHLPVDNFVEGLTIDSTGKLWWVNSNDESLNRFDAANGEWGHYPLPVGKNPTRIEAGIERMWYIESVSGTIGSLLQTAAGITTSLSAVTTTVPVSCTPLVENGRGSVTTTSGSIQWQTSSASVETIDQWEIYHPALAVKPFGLAIGQGFVWITDPNRQNLMRLPTSDTPGSIPIGSKIFLPVISR